MSEKMTLGEKIEEVLHYMQEKQCLEENLFYELLFPYIKGIVKRYYINPYKNDNQEIIEDITQNVMVDIFQLDILHFEEKGGKFVTYCGVIAKNKVIDAMRWQKRHPIMAEEKIDYNLSEKSVEAIIMDGYEKLELINLTKRYMRLFIELPEKPYRLVSCCYTILLYQRYFPHTTELSSPKWAYEQLEEDCVEEGADRFIREINEWIPYMQLYWSDEFLDKLYDVEFGKRVGELVFGEQFKKKDFENWSIRIREKVKKKMIEEEYKQCIKDLSR